MSDIKYPRTPHLPGSPGATSDDKVLESIAHLLGEEVVCSKKMDGEQSTLKRDGFHARSLDSRHHESRDWLARLHGEIAHEIPVGWRICGENLFAVHSLAYSNLKSYFYGFSVWDENDVRLAWDDGVEFMELLGLQPVEVMYRGKFEEGLTARLVKALDVTQDEGFVIALAGRVRHADFANAYGKWVRAGHVQTDEHWMHKSVVRNQLEVVGGSKA